MPASVADLLFGDVADSTGELVGEVVEVPPLSEVTPDSLALLASRDAGLDPT